MLGSMVFALVASQPADLYLPPPIPIPQEVRDAIARERRSRPAAPSGGHILYVNFDGATLHGGNCTNATTNCTFIDSVGTYNYPPYPGTQTQKDAILQRLAGYYADFDVQLVTTRPASGDYSMTMVGPGSAVCGASCSGGAAGVAPLDCSDTNPDDISFAFTDVIGTSDTYAIAVTIAQESAHGYGLGHTHNAQDIMYPALNHQETGFANSTSQIYDLGGGSSDCTGTGQQNSYQLLMQNIGAGGPDMQPPTITFNIPKDGDTVPSMFQVKFDASDNRGVTNIDLYADGNKIGSMGTSPFTFSIPGGFFSAGHHTLKGVAVDMAGNQADSGTITVTVQGLGENPGELGAACQTDADCAQGFCAFDSGANMHFCTRACDATANPCPDGFSCINAGGPMVCAPSTSSGGKSGGGCDVAASSQNGFGLAGLLLLGLGAFSLVLARSRRN